MSLCRRMECSCGTAIEDLSVEERREGRVVKPNLGIAACAAFASKHRGHGWLKGRVLNDEGAWEWDEPTRVQRL